MADFASMVGWRTIGYASKQAIRAQTRRWARVNKGKALQEISVFVGLLVVWFVMSRWILPRLGVPT